MSKTVIITGAGGAVADAVIKTFHDAGWNLALFDHSDKAKERLVSSYPQSAFEAVDLSDEKATLEVIEKTIKHFSSIEAVLNIAGGFALHSATETSHEDFKKQMSINFRTVFNTTRAILPHMLERGSGFILGVSAAAAMNGGSKMGPYAAAKAAMTAYLKSVRAEVEPKGVSVSILYPMGNIDTPNNRASMPKADPNTWIDPVQLAESMLYLATRSARGRIRELMVYPPA